MYKIIFALELAIGIIVFNIIYSYIPDIKMFILVWVLFTTERLLHVIGENIKNKQNEPTK